MDIKRKMEIAKQAITSISRHDDADSLLRNAKLDSLKSFIDSEKTDLAERAQRVAEDSVKEGDNEADQEQKPADPDERFDEFGDRV